MADKLVSINKKELCCICGEREAATRDHLPPKGIFNDPKPNNLITVPACKTCNNEASLYDERFKIYLGLHAAKNSSNGNLIFKNKVLPSIRHNRKVKQQILYKVYPLFISNEFGVAEKNYAISWDNEAHEAIIDRLTRGLFYHHYMTILPKIIPVKIYWFSELPDFDADQYHKNSVGDDFVYFYNKAEDVPFYSAWFYQFYNAHWAGAITDYHNN